MDSVGVGKDSFKEMVESSGNDSQDPRAEINSERSWRPFKRV